MARITKMGADNITFGVDQQGELIHPLQYIREVVQNGIDAGATKILLDVDWSHYEITRGTVKLCCIDNGRGMSAEDMLRYLNRMWSCGGVQGLDANFGAGMKVSAPSRNHAGVQWSSWKDGVGHMARLVRDPIDGYGLLGFELDDGSVEETPRIPDESSLKPALIRDHGTKVTFFGMTDEQDTLRFPTVGTARSYLWIVKYLNTRYFMLPSNVDIRGRCKVENPSPDDEVRTVKGMRHFLDDIRSESRGEVRLSDASAYWWVLPTHKKKRSDNLSSFYQATGHVAAIHGIELYDMYPAEVGGRVKLQQFGAVLSPGRVVIYVRPDESAGFLPDLSRTHLRRLGDGLPWDRWADEFRAQLPPEIQALRGNETKGKDLRNEVRELLSKYAELLRVPRFKPDPDGDLRATEDAAGGKPRPSVPPEPRTPNPDPDPRPRPGGGRSDREYAGLLTPDGNPGRAIGSSPDYPNVIWVSANPNERFGDAERDGLEDRAAEYVRKPNELHINADFRGFRHIIELVAAGYEPMPAIVEAIEREARKWWELQLTEVVMATKTLRGAPKWDTASLDSALSPEALTAVAMSRSMLIGQVKASVGSKLGAMQRSKVDSVVED